MNKEDVPNPLVFVGQRDRMFIQLPDVIQEITQWDYESNKGSDSRRLTELEAERLSILVGKKNTQVLRVIFEDVTDEYLEAKK